VKEVEDDGRCKDKQKRKENFEVKWEMEEEKKGKIT